jgi:uncharacterized membrane protein YeaQ/YmgE (transglycosylase-associated protein family)
MTRTLSELIILVVIAALCGAIGRSLAGNTHGGGLVSVALGLIGALIGTSDRPAFGPYKKQVKKRLYGRTKPGTLLKHQIPIRAERWETTEPGFGEIDLSLTQGVGLMGSLSTP